MTDRRTTDPDEAAGRTIEDTLSRLRDEDALVYDFVAAGGLSAFRALEDAA